MLVATKGWPSALVVIVAQSSVMAAVPAGTPVGIAVCRFAVYVSVVDEFVSVMVVLLLGPSLPPHAIIEDEAASAAPSRIVTCLIEELSFWSVGRLNASAIYRGGGPYSVARFSIYPKVV